MQGKAALGGEGGVNLTEQEKKNLLERLEYLEEKIGSLDWSIILINMTILVWHIGSIFFL